MSKFPVEQRSWFQKFKFAFIGIALGIKGQSSFVVHILMAIAVVAIAAFLKIPLQEWAILLICITMVVAAETFNSALETIAKEITDDHSDHIAAGLNIASGAVLVAAIGAAIVGLILLGNRLLCLFVRDSPDVI